MRISKRVAALAAATAVLAGACGQGSSLDVEADPKGAVVEAFENMSEWDGGSFTLRVDSDVASLTAMAEGDEAMTPELARAILDSFVEFEGTSGEDLADTSDDEFAMLVRVGDIDAFEVRNVGGQLYGRADVLELVEEYDDTGTAAADIQEGLAEAREFGFDFLQTAAEGGWLHFVGYEQVASMLQGMTGAPTPEPSEAEALAAEMATAFKAFVQEDVDVTYVGADDAGEHVRLTATGDELLDLLGEILEVAGPMVAAGMGGMDPAIAIEELRREAGPDAATFTMPLDVWIDGDTISRVSLDVVAFVEANAELMEADEKPVGLEKFAVIVDLEEFDGGVEAPEDATTVDLFEIFGKVMGGFGGGFGDPAAA